MRKRTTQDGSARGRADAPYLFVMVSDPSEGMEAWFWRQLQACGIKKTEVRMVFMIDEPPANAGNKPSVAQLRAGRERFEHDVRRSTPKVVLPMGTEAFYRPPVKPRLSCRPTTITSA